MSSYVVVPNTDPDSPFHRRSVYWRPGHNVLREPWVALAECNTGHLIVPCADNRRHAEQTVATWAALQRRGQHLDAVRRVYGGVVVSPVGELSQAWDDGAGFGPPRPGGPTRWVPLRRMRERATCTGCGRECWAGCWLIEGLGGCAACQPEREAPDPRAWPPDPPDPALRLPPTVGPRLGRSHDGRAVRVASPTRDRL